VVHGPLIATLLLDLLARSGVAPERFAFRATAPCFCDRPLELRGRPDETGFRLWAVRDDGALALRAEAA
jgi:3-methylfumaryl-CoA hydratase